MAALALTVGCGGAGPAVSPSSLTLRDVAAGAYVAGCLVGETLVAARPFRLEWWTLAADEPPAWRATVDLVEARGGAPVTALGCADDRVRVERSDGGALGLTGQAVTWRGASPGPGWPTVGPSEPTPTGSLWAGRLPDGREAVLGAWGRGTRRGDRFLEWRAAAGGLVDATWDGHHVWAVGAHGLWRWTPGAGEALPVALPPGLAGRPLAAVFRDRGLIWVRDADGRGWPLDVQGAVALPMGPPGRLPTMADDLRAPLGDGWRVDGRVGVAGLRLIDEGGFRRAVATPSIRALEPLDRRTVALATDEGVEVWRRDDDRLTRVARGRAPHHDASAVCARARVCVCVV